MTADQPQSSELPSWRVDTDASIGSIALGPADVEAKQRGAVLRFTWYAADGDALVDGDLSEAPSGLIMTRAVVEMQDASGITRDLLRRLPIGDILAAARKHQRGSDPLVTAAVAPAGRVEIINGRAKMDDDLLRNVALAYVKETGPEKGRGAMKRMAERFGRPEGTVQTWIKRARKEGWLAPGPPGRMGAEAGPKLLSWMGETLRSTQAIREEAGRVAEELGLQTYGQKRDALLAYDDPAEREISQRMGLPPLEAAVASQALYRRALSAELGARVDAGVEEMAVYDEMARELREKIGERQASS